MSLVFYHNPRCSKSREALELLTDKGAEFAVKEYLNQAPSIDELKDILKKLGCKSPLEIVRTKEDLYKELNIDSFKDDHEKVLKTLASYPKLIERPILISERHAVIGRPPEKILTLL